LDIEFHQLELRYQTLRKLSPHKERLLLGSLAESGQQMPVVVVTAGEPDRYVLVDGYKRVRALQRLGADTVMATIWQLSEADALLMERLMRCSEPEGALEQGWLLRELRDRFGMSCGQLAQRFDRTVSWVSRRLGLVSQLPESVEKLVCAGAIGAHAAMKYLVPLARANAEQCVRLAQAVAFARLSTRQLGELYAAWTAGNEQQRERLLLEPLLYLQSVQEVRTADTQEKKSPSQLLIQDIEILSSVARRAYRRFSTGIGAQLLAAERQQANRCAGRARADLGMLFQRWDKELGDVAAERTRSDTAIT
jgi:ParB family transcriptional regulator, chromosome partitioning protein